MKKSNWLLTLIFFLTLTIYASPENDSLELVATFCHFSDTGTTCKCPEEAKENGNEQKKTARKIRRDSTCITSTKNSCSA